MLMIDFEYDGIRLSSKGLMICSFDGGRQDIELGNNIEINKVKASNNDKYMNVGYRYEDALTFEFAICKSLCNGTDVLSFTDTEINDLMRWLNRKKFCKFKPFFDDNSFSGVYFNGTFNLDAIMAGSDVVGFNVVLGTNAPYGFLEPVVKELSIANAATDKLIINDTSNEIGHVNCNATITCKEAGALTIRNSIDPDHVVIIKDVQPNEIITINGEQKIITTSRAAHNKLCNDFNYNYLRVVNDFQNNENIFTFNLKCDVVISYSPIKKVGMIA